MADDPDSRDVFSLFYKYKMIYPHWQSESTLEQNIREIEFEINS